MFIMCSNVECCYYCKVGLGLVSWYIRWYLHNVVFRLAHMSKQDSDLYYIFVRSAVHTYDDQLEIDWWRPVDNTHRALTHVLHESSHTHTIWSSTSRGKPKLIYDSHFSKPSQHLSIGTGTVFCACVTHVLEIDNVWLLGVMLGKKIWHLHYQTVDFSDLLCICNPAFGCQTSINLYCIVLYWTLPVHLTLTSNLSWAWPRSVPPLDLTNGSVVCSPITTILA